MTDETSAELPVEIDVETCAAWRRESGAAAILDVREAWELATARLDGCIHIPMQEVPARLESLPRDRPLVVMCHHGMRSMQVTMWLRRAGIANAVNLAGGIDAWARRIDPSVPLY